MRLPKMKKLMGLLAIGMQMSVVTAMVGASSFTVKEKENIVSAISFLMLLKRRKGTNKAFLLEFRRLLSVCNEKELLTTISVYEDENPDLLKEDTKHSGAVESVGYDSEPTQCQSHRFKGALYKISESIGKGDLEILVALAPIPEASKENVDVGHELFHRMGRHGCISENDTELLQEMLELLELRAACQILLKYRREFSSSSSTGDDDSLSHPVEELNQDSSSPCSRVLDPTTYVQPEMGASVKIVSPSSFSPKEQSLPHLQDGLDSSSDSYSQDLDVTSSNCGSTSLKDSEIKLTTKLLPERKRPRADDSEQYPVAVEEEDKDSGSYDLVDSPPPTKTLCVANGDSQFLAACSSDGADTHWRLQVAFSSTAPSVCTEGEFCHSSTPPESDSATNLGCPQNQG